MKFFITLFSLVLLIIESVISNDVEDSTYCESYNQMMCTNENKENCKKEEKCGPAGPERHNHCFTLWEYNSETGLSSVQLKGCFLNNKNCFKQSYCIQKNKDEKNQLYFCCCNGNMCNKNFTFTQFLENRDKKLDVVEIESITKTEQQVFTLILAVAVFFFIVTVSFVGWYYRHRKFGYDSEATLNQQLSKAEMGENPKQLQHQQTHEQQVESEDPIDLITTTELIEKRAQGRFRAVWKGRRCNDTVAVKVFPLRDKHSWQTELNIFQLPCMDHEDVLKFVGSYRLGSELDAEFWLVTAYHEKGSLCDYLAANPITYEELCRIAESIIRGLNHLHREVETPQGYKPAIAHRDFKSKNVLLRADLRACIADFGLALVFPHDGTCRDNRSRVGTLRYMAPEVLDGAINFTKKSFLAIDMYACGLVLWELVSRCIIKEDLPTEYKLPFEEEVGLHPTLEEMYACVVGQKNRPHIPEIWKTHVGLSLICDTIEECWDDDAEARVSASCVLDRIISLK